MDDFIYASPFGFSVGGAIFKRHPPQIPSAKVPQIVTNVISRLCIKTAFAQVCQKQQRYTALPGALCSELREQPLRIQPREEIARVVDIVSGHVVVGFARQQNPVQLGHVEESAVLGVGKLV